ncbi:uracil-DNA glycosylase [Halorussus limi]|uniref:Uracil-DNA glycosylase n=1 Tax=Halorussus limi TaxID=2938695 RepID=A0A8U0HZ18_9EURY|nr:uracil-DNA glycosylase family protein [Halorussus limi]UPV76129.1 uracil-DNA glycosylase [Halorussus limi]
MTEYPDPDSRNVLEPGCARCPALVESRERISWGNGSLDTDVVVVGEAPALGVEPRSTETRSGDEPRVGDPGADRWRGGNRTGMAYTSRHSGRAIRDLFADAELAPEDLYFTNAVKCFPADSTGDSNREPTADERANCRGHLRTEIESVDPAVVATTGKHATLSVLECETRPESREGERRSRESETLPDGFLDAVLDPVESTEFGTTVLPLLHPSYQNVWLPRIGRSREEYVAEIAAVVRDRREE